MVWELGERTECRREDCARALGFDPRGCPGSPVHAPSVAGAESPQHACVGASCIPERGEPRVWWCDLLAGASELPFEGSADQDGRKKPRSSELLKRALD